jgi:hypothetical protein
MKPTILPVTLVLGLLFSCASAPQEQKEEQQAAALPLTGTWRLISGATITKGDTAVTDYTKGMSMIKIINGSHFAFLKHNQEAPKDSSNQFDGGGGTYTLEGNTYTEHLDYYGDRNWEGKTFTFTVSISNDTLTQKGIEKVEGAGVDHEIIERYVRLK